MKRANSLVATSVIACMVASCTSLPKAPAVAPKPTVAMSPPNGTAAAVAAALPAGTSAATAASVGIPGGPFVAGEPRPYDAVITKDAKTSRGMLLHHKIKDRHLFEIPERILGRDLLWSAEISQASAGGGFNGLPLGYRVVRFERVDNRILLRSVSYRNRGVNDLKAAADAVDLAPIVMAFAIEAEGSERSRELRGDEKRLLEKEKADKEKAAKDQAEKEKSDQKKAERAKPGKGEKTAELIVPANGGQTLENAIVSASVVATLQKDALEQRAKEIMAAKRQHAESAVPPVIVTEAMADAKVAAKPAIKSDAKAETKLDTKSEAKPDGKPDARPEAKVDSKERRAPATEKWPVIDVTRLLQTTSSDLIDARNMGPMGFGGVDPTRSMIGQVKVFENNVEARALLTFASLPMPQMGAGGMPAAPSVPRNPSKSAIVHYSIALLPEQPMQGRFFDERVGYFTEAYLEFGGERTGTRLREYITRFRLEKKDPAAAVSEPVKPIIFYIAQEVPEKWRKHLIAGVEDWKPAFEAAGFKNAIQAKMAPTKTEDPNWDPEDARYSVIRWVALPINNAMGPHLHDPRSGEIISAHIIFWHDLLAGLERSYFAQAGAADKRIDKLPLSDEVMGELVRSVATHEVGHTLGLRHNHRASTAYSINKLRDPVFTRNNGTTASIMSYGRFNSVAQPGDGVTSFVPKIGPYDTFAIEWGYKPLGKKSAEDERADLDKMAARQLNEPLLKFGGEDFAAFLDPEVLTENIGKERIEATKLSVASLERAAARIIPATTRLGEDFEQLENMYYQLVNQRSRYIGSVVKLIGGVRETRYLGGRGGDTFSRTTPQEQQAAIRYLLDDALATPKWLTDANVLNRISMIDVAGPVVNAQKRILGEMLQPIRFRVMEDAESLQQGNGMTAMGYLTTVQKSVFREAFQPAPKVDIYRRELQREYVEHLKVFSGEVQRFKNLGMMMSSLQTDLVMDLRPAAMQGMKDLRRDLLAAERQTKDTSTRLHFAQLARELDKILKIRGS
jgi:hypothetical protein